jgi:uncharacterized cupredoxin-like copper-binding protein
MTITTGSRTRRLALVGSALALVLVAGACGDDDDSASATTAASGGAAPSGGAAAGGDAGIASYCEAVVEVEAAFATVEEDTDLSSFAPIVTELIDLAPAEVHHHAVAMGAAFEQAAAGDPSGFESPEVAAANEALHAYELQNCGWAQVDVALADYAFEGVPDEVAAGVTSFELTNEGKEAHVMVVVRRKDGVTEPYEELLALPEEEAMAKIDLVGSVFVAPGGSDSMVVDLEPGQYFLVCPIPTGTTADAEGTGAPHFTHGMTAELNVA